MATMNFLPSVLTFDPPSKQNSISTYRAIQHARTTIMEMEQKLLSHDHKFSPSEGDLIQTAIDDLELLMGAVK